MTVTVLTFDSSQKAILVALKCNRAVVIVHKMMCPRTSMISNRADRPITALKGMDSIFLAVSVNTVPASQRIAYKSYLFIYLFIVRQTEGLKDTTGGTLCNITTVEPRFIDGHALNTDTSLLQYSLSLGMSSHFLQILPA